MYALPLNFGRRKSGTFRFRVERRGANVSDAEGVRGMSEGTVGMEMGIVSLWLVGPSNGVVVVGLAVRLVSTPVRSGE